MECNKKYDRWTDEEVQALLSVFAEEEIQWELETATRNEKVYLKMSSRLCELGIVHTGKQCREKLKKLKQDYKKIKDHNNRSGSDRRTNKWFDRLDALLGHRPSFSGSAVTKDSATALLEAMPESDEHHYRDSDFLDALREMDDANRAVLQRGQEQRDLHMQLLLESQAEEREMRRQELAFLQSEAKESRRQQRDFQAGFLSVLGEFVQSFKK
ncbi:hypothetical protein ABG768_013269 [Culter alburnus]|uniref:Myb/SANT-like DNA-binding domain-containing protein n=1 Tax=Culter alburnus TaxID=194366 RepID=A0AAW2B1J6_CULAL